ncbi:hypothetical protein BDV59DRAFT_47003 [Aspergillus ambiguus]|uniref:uncharacterized protein n=1 Tax=Aspergillus ambiguus TaxID=176160 RepID=UPI003CCD6D03
MAQLPVRNISCPAGKQWYVCSAGNYHGCCAVDPCTTGVCPDENGVLSMSSSTATPTMSSTSTRTKAETTQSFSSTSTSSITASAPPTEAVSSAPSTVVSSAKAAHKKNEMVVGGVVGGVVGFLVLLGMALFLLWYSRRKRHGREVSAHPIVSLSGLRPKRERRKRPGLVTDRPSMEYSSDDCITTSYSSHAESNARNTKGPFRPSPARTPPTKPPTKPSPTRASPTTRVSPAGPATRLPLSRQPPTDPPSTGRSPTSTTIHTARSIVTTNTTNSSSTTPTISSLTSSNVSLPIGRTGSGLTTRSHRQLPAVRQRPTLRTPPELPDTGFYRQRAELPSSSSRELINKFNPRRQLCKSVEFENGSLHDAADAGGQPRAGPVVTADGAVLTANFERMSCPDEVLSTSSDSVSSAHVMSFMQYDPEWDAALPAYQPSWRRSLKLEKIEES